MTQLPGFPDFFVVGAPRCGTTALCRYLEHNPQICLSRPKETHYFAQIGGPPSERELQSEYIERYFGHREAGQRVAGEGSVSYLYLPGAIERILHFNPAARFIAMVRNPMSMLPSYHLKMRFLLQEDEEDFARAWSLQEARARGESVPRFCHDPRLLMYREVAGFGRQIERLFSVAGRERTHVIVFDDFLADPLAAYRRALDFLQIDYDGQTWFFPKNESRIYRYRWLQRLLYVPMSRGGSKANTPQRVARKFKLSESRRRGSRRRGSKKRSWVKSLVDWNKVPATPRPLTQEMRAVVAEALRPDNELLSRLLQRDLGFWLD